MNNFSNYKEISSDEASGKLGACRRGIGITK